MLGVLLLIQAHNYMDRQALSLVLQNIKTDLQLTDTQLGLLTGIPFAIFYAVLGIPMARWADRGNRVGIISLSVAIWSVFVALCGRATSFTQFMLLRAGIGVGEAGCLPPAQALIADEFPRATRPWAMSIYMLGGPFSTLVGMFVAGWLTQLYGWRTMFMLLGLPGLVLTLLARFTLREPRLRGSKAGADEPTPGAALDAAPPAAPRSTLPEVVRTLWTNHTFRYLLFAFWVQYFLVYGVAQFQPAFFTRSYGLEIGDLGTRFALAFGLSSLIGVYVGGRFASRYAANNESLQLKVAAATFGIFSLTSGLAYLSSSLGLTLVLLAVGTLVVNLATGTLWAMAQSLVPPQMRAVASASIFLFANLFGLGLGPLAVGALSDALQPWLHGESLRYALLFACAGYWFGTWCLARASQTIATDLQAAQQYAAAP